MDPWTVLSALGAIALVFVVAPVGLTTFAHWRRPLRVTCPRDAAEAEIQVDAGNAALAALVGRGPRAVRQCSLWPTRRYCRSQCLAMSAASLPPSPEATVR